MTEASTDAGSVGAITASMPTERCTPRTRVRQNRVATQLAIEDNGGDAEHRERQHHQQQHLPVHDRLRLTMVRIVTIPVVSIPTAAAKTVRPCGSTNSV